MFWLNNPNNFFYISTLLTFDIFTFKNKTLTDLHLLDITDHCKWSFPNANTRDTIIFFFTYTFEINWLLYSNRWISLLLSVFIKSKLIFTFFKNIKIFSTKKKSLWQNKYILLQKIFSVLIFFIHSVIDYYILKMLYIVSLTYINYLIL